MDKRAIPDPRGFIEAKRSQWQAQSTRRQWVLGMTLLATAGPTLGAALGWMVGSPGGFSGAAGGAAAGAVMAMWVGPLAAWLARSPKLEALPDLAFPPRVQAIAAEDPTAIRDGLTGAYTQRYFIAAAEREWSRIHRHGEDAALLMIDADRLSAVNQAHGMDCGDAMLVQLTRLVSATLRQYDLMARFNAGVLVVYLPNTDPIGAIDVAERIRERIAEHRMSWSSGPVSVTVSVGVAAIGDVHNALDAVIGDAGIALRQAKAAGRNCVRAAPVPPRRLPASGTTLGDRRAH